MQENFEIYRLLFYFTNLTVEILIIALKMTSQLVISELFYLFFLPSPDPKSEKNPVNQQIKKIWP